MSVCQLLVPLCALGVSQALLRAVDDVHGLRRHDVRHGEMIGRFTLES